MAKFNPNQQPKPTVLIGTFPAHISKFTKGNEFNGGIPFNTEVIFDDCTGLKGTNSQGKEFDAEHMHGAYSKGETAWFNANPDSGQEWKNGRYFQWCTAAGFKFKETKVKDEIEYELTEVEEKDVWGKPVNATVKLQGTYKGDSGRTVYITVGSADEMTLAEETHKLSAKGIALYPTVVKVEPREGEALDWEEKVLEDLEAEEGNKEEAGF